MRDLWLFIQTLGRDWVGRITGGFGLAWTVMQVLHVDGAVYFGVVCLMAFFVASFRVWRKMYHEARPYDEETFCRAQARFAAMPDDWKAALKEMAIDESIPQESVRDPSKFEQNTFVVRNPTAGRFYLSQKYDKIIPRLIKEWESTRGNASP